MNDRPDARELLAAVERFLRDEVVGNTSGHLSYSARVAANVVAIVGRELESEGRHLSGEWLRLAALLGREGEPPADTEALREQLRDWTGELTERIRAGDADTGAWRSEVVSHLKQTVDDKLEVAKGPAPVKHTG